MWAEAFSPKQWGGGEKWDGPWQWLALAAPLPHLLVHVFLEAPLELLFRQLAPRGCEALALLVLRDPGHFFQHLIRRLAVDVQGMLLGVHIFEEAEPDEVLDGCVEVLVWVVP